MPSPSLVDAHTFHRSTAIQTRALFRALLDYTTDPHTWALADIGHRLSDDALDHADSLLSDAMGEGEECDYE